MKTTEKIHGCSEGGHEEGWCDTKGYHGQGEMEADEKKPKEEEGDQNIELSVFLYSENIFSQFATTLCHISLQAFIMLTDNEVCMYTGSNTD